MTIKIDLKKSRRRGQQVRTDLAAGTLSKRPLRRMYSAHPGKASTAKTISWPVDASHGLQQGRKRVPSNIKAARRAKAADPASRPSAVRHSVHGRQRRRGNVRR